MKILANRLIEDTEKNESDLDDAVGLMKVTRLTTAQQLVDLLKECYPGLPGIVIPVLSPRIKAKIETLLDAYRAEPLRRASMPKDGRWWAYETIRGGLTPNAEEQSELEQAKAPASAP